jgi:hypothetical protein
MKSPVDILFEQLDEIQAEIREFNHRVSALDEKKRKQCTIYPTDSGNKIRKKCKQAKIWGIHYAPVWDRYMTKPEPTPPSDGGDTGDSGADAGADGGDAGAVGEIQGTGLVYPNSIGPEDDEELTNEADSSTERVRRYYRRHPEKVRKYLKDTVKDRVARNRDRRKAVKKYGKKKMKNHDVHHPNGPNGGSWRLAKKDHGRDKKNENYVYLEELLEGNVPHSNWILINEGGAAGHMAHPYEDDSLTFKDVKEMIRRGLVGQLDAEAPVTEKLDGQNIMFTVKDGQVYFARNKGQVKDKGKNALDVAGIRQMFAGRGNIEKAFTGAAEDLQRAIDALPPEQRSEMFKEGGKFMNVEIVFPDTKNVIPYDKSVLVFHGTVDYDKDGNEVGRSIDDGKTLADQITKVNAQQQKTFGISGPKSIAFSDAETAENKKLMQKYGTMVNRLEKQYGLNDNDTIEDYKRAWWSREIDNMDVEWTKQEREGLISRWAMGEKKFGVKDIEDPNKKKFFRTFEVEQLKDAQREVARPLESVFLQVGAQSLRRVTNFLSANNPEMAAQLKKEVLDTIKELRNTDDRNKLAVLQKQVERLENIGIDKVVPTEGLVFIYNGKPYKFTGAFAPVNQILGTLKFDKGKAVEVPEEAPKETGPKKTIAIFTGRFQPFHSGHYSVYKNLVDRFGVDNVYIASSDKTEAIKSPFRFKDKEEIMTQMFGIPADKVVQVKNPYAPAEILQKMPDDTTYVTAVSQKDAERLGGKYFKNFDDVTDKKGYKEQGYFVIAPEMQLSVNGKNISGTQLRAIFGDDNITDRAKQEIFTKVYGKFDQDIFNKIVKTTTKAEEERKVTDTYKEKPAEPKAAPEAPKKMKKKPADVDIEKDRQAYKPGQTWQTPSGRFGAKNSQSKIGYFGSLERAKQFAKK